MEDPFPSPKQLEIVSGAWRPRSDWSPRYMMFTSYWPDPKSFVAYGTDGQRTNAVRGTWANDLSVLLKTMEELSVVIVRISRYPESDEVEVVRAGVSDPSALLPAAVGTDPTEPKYDQTAGPTSASMTITIPHWNAVARAFQRLFTSGPPAGENG